MTAFVIGLGTSGKDWFNHPHDFSIGVQDCAKWGKDPDYLLLIDSKQGFKREPERLRTITGTKPKKVFTHGDSWKEYFPKYERLRLQPFGKYLKKGHVYSSKSSPFVAISLAFNMGATDIVLFGVDMKNHHILQPGKKLFDYEMRNMKRFCKMLKDLNTRVWVSSEESSLNKFLNVWG